MASFNYNINLTGDCQNNGSGAIQVGFSGGTPPYTIAWAPPINQTSVLIYDFDPLNPTTTYETYSFVSGLSAATYSFRVNDSTVPTNLEYDVNVPVSSGKHKINLLMVDSYDPKDVVNKMIELLKYFQIKLLL